MSSQADSSSQGQLQYPAARSGDAHVTSCCHPTARDKSKRENRLLMQVNIQLIYLQIVDNN